MATLSLCMIVKDEAANLPRCLASVKDLVDEIVVLDTGSGDNTPMIAQAAGAQVNFLMWGDDFAHARNVSIAQATQEWILVLDADETLSASGRQLIAMIKQDRPLGQLKPEDIVLVTMLRQEIGAEQAPYTRVSRLFRNLPGIKFVRPYHEGVDESVEALMAKESHWQIAQLDAVGIGHTGYRVDAIAAKDKFARAQRIMAAHLAKHPEDSYIANKLGALYTQNDQWDKALVILTEALKSGNFDPLTEYELHYHLGITHRHLVVGTPDQANEAIAAAEASYRAAIAVPIDPKLKLGAYQNLGALLMLKGDLDGAMAQYEAAARIAPDQPMAYFNMGVVHRTKGHLEPALRAYEYTLTLDPNYAEAYQNLAVVLFKLGKLPESKRAFEQAIALMENTDPLACDRLRRGIEDLGLNAIP